uniref:RPA interacting protein n=1 Tax=Nothobranchius kuhntae TaxID=321403 RepID=A0A1A8IFH7_NOTKU
MLKCDVSGAVLISLMDAQLRHRLLYKRSTPPWREAFRRRCVDRLKNSRSRLVDRYRQRSTAGALSIVDEVMEEEWTALQAEDRRLLSLRGPRNMQEVGGVVQEYDELAVLDEIQQELMSHEISIIQEYERNLQLEQQYLSSVVEDMEHMHVICPICHMNNLSINSCFVSCPCGLHISTKRSVTPDVLQHLLESRVSEHRETCLQSPVFSIAPGAERSPSLFISCKVRHGRNPAGDWCSALMQIIQLLMKRNERGPFDFG